MLHDGTLTVSALSVGKSRLERDVKRWAAENAQLRQLAGVAPDWGLNIDDGKRCHASKPHQHILLFLISSLSLVNLSCVITVALEMDAEIQRALALVLQVERVFIYSLFCFNTH
jgi:hypothetical protein